MTHLEQQKAKARERLRPQLTNTRGVKPEVLDFARLLLGDFWQAQQKDLDEVIEATHQAAIEECVRVAEGMKMHERCKYMTIDFYRSYVKALTDLITTLKADK